MPDRRIDAVLTPEETRAFAQSVTNVHASSVRGLASCADATATIRFVGNLHRGIDRVFREEDARAPVACKAGCNHCCRARVEVLAPEAFLVATELSRRGDEALAATLATLGRHLAAGDDARSTWAERAACPFLVGGLCSIYDVRPAACRKAHSLDVAHCAAGSQTIPQNLRKALHGEALVTGMASAYHHRRLDADRHELIGAVVVALTVPSAEARWFGGERLFDPIGNPAQH